MAKHPTGLYMLSTVEMWERFSYYGMRAILTLFMITALFYTIPFSSSIYGFYTGFVYLTPLIGGYVADRYLGNRKSIILGALLMAIAQFTLAFSASLYNPNVTIATHSFFILNTQEIAFIIGLLLLIFGNGFFKPNISSMITFLYDEGDERINSAFTVFYMATNLGSLIAPLIIGFLVGDNNPALFKYGFMAAGVGMVIATAIFIALKNKYLKNTQGEPIGIAPNQGKHSDRIPEEDLDVAILKKFKFDDEIQKREHEKLKTLTHKEKEKIVNGPLTKVEKQRIAVIFIISFFAIFFWSAFEQAGVSLTYFTTVEVNRALTTSFIVPPEWFQSCDPFFIILFAPLFAGLWPLLHRKGIEPTIPAKIAIGLFILALGFLIMLIPGTLVDSGFTGVSMGWMVLIYFILAIAELFISPTGQSVVAKLSPVKFSSLLMAVWFASTAISNILAGQLSTLYPEPGAPTPYLLGLFPINGFASFFLIFAVMAIIGGTIIFLLRKPVNKWMNGIE